MNLGKRRVRENAAKQFTMDPTSTEVLRLPAEERAKMTCWCGAGPNNPCLNARGVPQGFQHKTRGLDRKVVEAIMRSSGMVPPWSK